MCMVYDRIRTVCTKIDENKAHRNIRYHISVNVLKLPDARVEFETGVSIIVQYQRIYIYIMQQSSDLLNLPKTPHCES